MKSQKEVNKEKLRWKKPLMITSIIVTVYIISLFVPLIKAYTQFPLYLIGCGRLPVIANDFAAAYSYIPPGTRLYEIHVFAHYYCTEQEAESHGYHLDPALELDEKLKQEK